MKMSPEQAKGKTVQISGNERLYDGSCAVETKAVGTSEIAYVTYTTDQLGLYKQGLVFKYGDTAISQEDWEAHIEEFEQVPLLMDFHDTFYLSLGLGPHPQAIALLIALGYPIDQYARHIQLNVDNRKKLCEITLTNPFSREDPEVRDLLVLANSITALLPTSSLSTNISLVGARTQKVLTSAPLGQQKIVVYYNDPKDLNMQYGVISLDQTISRPGGVRPSNGAFGVFTHQGVQHL